MSRPTVLVATTNPIMAYALRAKLDEECQKLDLRLEICQSGDKKGDGDSLGEMLVYGSAGALFDYLESLPPMALADTLVVLDVGVELGQAFEPAVKCAAGGWHTSEGERAGVAVELILRFPQVFPVIFSPAVPVSDQPNPGGQEKVVEPVSDLGTSDETWRGFHQLRKSLCVRDMPVNKGKPEPTCEGTLPAFCTPLHFVSPLDGGGGLVSTLARFARGMRCWFDPTGLRTLVRNRFLGTLFGTQGDWSNTWGADTPGGKSGLRNVLLERLDHTAVAIDEEREFAMLNAYVAYKFGRRSWIVTTFGEFDDKPLWNEQAWRELDSVMLRDVDLRFPDVPDKEGVRAGLKDIHDTVWKGKSGNDWRIRVVSSDPNVESEKEFGKAASRLKECQKSNCFRLGQYKDDAGNLHYLGLSKPISSLYDLKGLLKSGSGEELRSVAARLGTANDRSGAGGHGAPYLNLAIAESLLLQAGCHNHGPTGNLLGAFLAGEAYELLLGMSKTTALEALLMQHKREVAAEGEFPGIAQAANIEERKGDIEKSVEALLSSSEGKRQIQSVTDLFLVEFWAELKRAYRNGARIRSVTDLFLVKFWAELKLAYRNGEQFHAAEEANAQSLIRGDWLKRFPDWLRKIFAAIPFKWRLGVKSWLVRVATSFWSWVKASLLTVVVATLAYPIFLQDGGIFGDHPIMLNFRTLFNCDGWKEIGNLFLSVMLSSITLQPMTRVQNIVEHGGDVEHFVAIVHMGVSYLLFGVLISMLYRKVTRG